MSLKIDPTCLMCHFQRNLEVAQTLGTPEQAMEFAKDMMRMYLDAPDGVSSPWFNPQVADLMEKHYHRDPDCWHQEKVDSNRFVLDRLDTLRSMVNSAPDPVFAGLQFSILGNYLDFSALRGNVSFEDLDGMLSKALEMQLDRSVYQAFLQDLSRGKRLLYVTDNAGEIGFDRLFAEAIAAKFPHLEITFCVRGGIAQNDATRADAAEVGIPFPVIDNGNRVPGTQLDQLSPEAKDAFDRADVILAKGMGNCETMHGCGLNVYYAFLVKCQKFVTVFKQPLMTPMFVKERT